MLKVSIRDFQQKFYTYNRAKEDLVVTSKGKEVFKVVYCSYIKRNVVTNEVIPNVVTIKNKEDVVTKVIARKTVANEVIPDNDWRASQSVYGCGCPKEAGNNLCGRHSRV